MGCCDWPSLVLRHRSAFLDTLGWIYYQLDDIPEAVRHLHRAARLRPGDETITGHLDAALIRAEALGLPANVKILCVIPMGVPAENPEPKDKWKPENIHWEKW